MVTDRQGIPSKSCVTGANRHDSLVFEIETTVSVTTAGSSKVRRSVSAQETRWKDSPS
jgi:hypothetical protein